MNTCDSQKELPNLFVQKPTKTTLLIPCFFKASIAAFKSAVPIPCLRTAYHKFLIYILLVKSISKGSSFNNKLPESLYPNFL